MIADKETNFVYISGLLESRCPGVFKDLTYWFKKLEIAYGILPGTKDLWVVDFMPLQVSSYNFVQFNYDPDYLKPKQYQHTRTNPQECISPLQIKVLNNAVVLDGGNVVKHTTKAILTAKIFKENPGWKEDELLAEIKNKLQVEQLIIIPQEPGDFVGHADGMVRFIDENTVLVNHYPETKKYQIFADNLRSALRNAGLKCVAFPYTAWQNADANDATGCYINFLEIDKYIFIPAFGICGDELAASQLKGVFIDREIIIIDCSELAKSGGVLNCATWNMLQIRRSLQSFM